MYELGAALLATGVAYLLNRWGLNRFGLTEVVWFGPCLEEAGKTYFALLLNAAVWWVHVLFGFIEGIVDVWGGSPRAISAALVSVVGHGIFGYVTIWGATAFSAWWPGVLLAIGAHILWNGYVVVFLAKRYSKQEDRE